jgi:hypothetical protein
VHFGCGEEGGASMSVERYEIHRRIGPLEIRSNRGGLSLNTRCTAEVLPISLPTAQARTL